MGKYTCAGPNIKYNMKYANTYQNMYRYVRERVVYNPHFKLLCTATQCSQVYTRSRAISFHLNTGFAVFRLTPSYSPASIPLVFFTPPLSRTAVNPSLPELFNETVIPSVFCVCRKDSVVGARHVM